MKLKIILALTVCVYTVHLPLSAQRNYDNDSEAWIGPAIMGSQTSFGGIYEMLVDESIFLPTPYEERIVNTLGGAIWTRFLAPKSNFFIEGQFAFHSIMNTGEPMDEGHFHLENDMELEYTILFDYDQVNFGLFPGWFFPFSDNHRSALGAYITAGVSWSILSGTSIDYVSNEPQFDLAIEESLEQGFKYRNDLILQVGGGVQYKLHDALALEARYTQGWGQIDILETQNNPFFWSDKTNKTRLHHQIALAVLFLFNG